jgi:hypothetical protein
MSSIAIATLSIVDTRLLAADNDVHCTKAMPRTAPRRRNHSSQTPLDRYQALAHHEKLICWRYYQFIATEGREGWNTAEVGSVFHYRSSAYIQSQGSAHWFRHKAQSMVKLAELFAEQNQTPPEPSTDHSDHGDDNNPPPLLPTLPNPPSRRVPAPASPAAAAAAAAATILMPPTAAPRTPRAVPPPNPRDQGNQNQQGLTAPTSFGLYRPFDYTSRQSHPTMQIRMVILHNGVEPQDIQFEWINPRKLQLRTAWPEWFQNPEMMSDFNSDDDGEQLFPPNHALTMDTSERNQLLVEEDGRIWDYGYLDFEQDMKTENPEFELLSVQLPNRIGTSVNVLQAQVQ